VRSTARPLGRALASQDLVVQNQSTGFIDILKLDANGIAREIFPIT
jgi:hypothetical protein